MIALLAAALLMSNPLDVAADKITEWRRDPVTFVRENFNIEPDAWQKDELRAFADPSIQRIATQACAGPGKSAVKAWEGLNFLACYGDKGHHPAGYALSVTGDNLRDNLWKELALWRSRSEFLTAAFEWQKEQIFARDHPATWWLRAKTWSKSADAAAQGRTLSGLHSRFILYLIDESGDISPSVLQSAEQGLSNCEWGKISIDGNPTSHTGMLYHAVKEQSGLWKVIRITGDPDDPKRSPRIDLEWARGQIKAHGRENPWVMAFVLGLFPPTSLNALLGPDEVRDAIGRAIPVGSFEHVQKRIGTDVARFGDDRTVLFPRQGLVAYDPVAMRGARSHAIAGRLMMAKQKWGSEMEFIDDTGGWASGVIDSCLLGGVSLFPVNASSTPNNPRYYNKRSEMYFEIAEWVKRGGSLPDGIPELVQEATAATYWFEDGKFRVVEKAQIKKLLNGHSPDYWEALMQTFALPDMPAAGTMQARSGGRMASDYDPLAEHQSAGMLS